MNAANFRSNYGPWALVTGASSGIGEEVAKQVAALGLNVVVVARRRERLEKLCVSLERQSVDTLVVEADLATEAGVLALFDQTSTLDVGLAVCNAGFGLKGEFVDIALERQLDMVQLNCVSTLHIAHHFSRRLIKRGGGGLIITSSMAAFQGTPFTSAYAATKGFDLLLAEGLWYELRPRGVDVVALCPGATDTEGPKRTGVNPDKVPNMMSVQPVVRAALRRLGGSPVVVPGMTNRIGTALTRLVPRSMATSIAARLIERATS
jgi:short-subunit dehydrogenase